MTPQHSPASHPTSFRNFLPARLWSRLLAAALLGLALLAIIGALVAGHLLRSAARHSLPQLSGTVILPGLAAPVTVVRDPHGIPSLHARTFSDLLFAQGFTTAQDRLFQMDTLRRHAAGELAEILGPKLVPHDRAQRILSLGPAADRILTQLPPDQLHDLQRYSDGVNAAIALATSGHAHPGSADRGTPTDATLHLPIEFQILAYTPRPWTPRDSVLVSLALFQDLTNTFPSKLAREALEQRLAPSADPALRTRLLADLYPVGSWRDHPPSQPATDLSAPTDFQAIPLDDSQTRLHLPSKNSPISTEAKRRGETSAFPTPTPAAIAQLANLLTPICPTCRAGSNNWAVSGAHTQSGKPLLSNDMHLALTAPGIWYSVNLLSDTGPSTSLADVATAFHVAGVSLPGVPYVVVGHNDHVAWGFTNLGADVQDLVHEHLQGDTFELPDGSFQPLHHRSELIRVRGARNLTLDVRSTVHDGVETPLLNPILNTPGSAAAAPTSLHWTLLDTNGFSLPFAAANNSTSAAALADAFRTYTGPTQNLIAADDQGHILYHAIGRIPIRGSLTTPSAISPVPTDATAPDAASHNWVGYIPYDQLPSTADPTGGVLATANARITPADYPFPVTLNWAGPYRNERIWHQLTGTTGLNLGDMRALQVDIFSDSDQRIAHRFAYGIDHTQNTSQRLKLAADLLRSWDGQVAADTPAPAINAAARSALWQLILAPHIRDTATADLLSLYTWGERDFAQEQIVAHLPARWLPPAYPNWDALLAAAVDQGLRNAHAPGNLRKWRFGHTDPTELELPLFAQSPLLRRIVGLPTGTGILDLPGNGNTIRQSHHNFGASERISTDLSDPADATLVLPLGESGNPASPFFRDQLPAWLTGAPQALPYLAPGGPTLILSPSR